MLFTKIFLIFMGVFCILMCIQVELAFNKWQSSLWEREMVVWPMYELRVVSSLVLGM